MSRPPAQILAQSMRATTSRALGTTMVVRAPGEHLPGAHLAAASVVRHVDELASRFRPDSELSKLNAAGGAWTAISADLLELVDLALWAVEISEGAVDPTLGADLCALGYDRDLGELRSVDPSTPLAMLEPGRARGRPWLAIEHRDDVSMVQLTSGTMLDLGATAKGRAADLAADAAHAVTGGPVLVALGGDLAVAGPPPDGGWLIGIAEDHRADPSGCAEAIAVHDGGIATSSLTTRRWWHDGQPIHHVLDPASGMPVDPVWALASVAAATCADANIAATAALVLGQAAPEWLARQKVPARLVAVDGTTVRIGGWPG